MLLLIKKLEKGLYKYDVIFLHILNIFTVHYNHYIYW